MSPTHDLLDYTPVGSGSAADYVTQAGVTYRELLFRPVDERAAVLAALRSRDPVAWALVRSLLYPATPSRSCPAMPATSLVRFMNRRSDGHGGRYHWGRVDLDGLPFRQDGPEPPPWLTSEEADERLVPAGQVHVRTFRLWEPQDAADYTDVLDRVYNNLAVLVRDRIPLEVRETWTDPDTGRRVSDVRLKMHVEWAELAMVDGRPMPSQRPYLGRPNND